MADFQDLQNEIGKWADDKFGVGRKPLSTVLHLREEVDELLKDCYSSLEFADCIILLLESARLAGLTVEDLRMATEAKFIINKSRKWGTPDEKGIIRRIKIDGKDY